MTSAPRDPGGGGLAPALPNAALLPLTGSARHDA